MFLNKFLNNIVFFKVIIQSKYLALKRRFCLYFYKNYDPYPKVPSGLNFSPSKFHENYANKIIPKISFENTEDSKDIFQEKTREKIKNLIGFEKNLEFKIINSKEYIYKKKYIRKRFLIRLDKDREMPIETLLKISEKNLKGVMVCMQGTNSGSHLNFGEIKMPIDPFKVHAGSSLAIQAADNGYIAISFDRIGYGERREKNLKKQSILPVMDISLHSLALGKSLLGETVSEIYVICKHFKNFYNLPLWLVGYSSAGSVATVAGALFNNLVNGICVGGCIGSFKETIMKRGGTAHLEIKDCIKWFDQDVLIQLMAPRPCIMIAGDKDHIWPYSGAIIIYEKSKKIYKLYNAKKFLTLIKAIGVHTYYPKLMWSSINFYIKDN